MLSTVIDLCSTSYNSFFSIVGAGIAVLAIPVSGSFYVLACSVGLYGLCLGCWFLLVPVLLADQYGTEKISSSYGLVRMFQSVGAISVPPLAGKYPNHAKLMINYLAI